MSNTPPRKPASVTSKLTYRVAPGGESPETWVVAARTLDKPGPAVATGFATRAAAQAEADRINALANVFEAGDAERRDEVLGRMLRRSSRSEA